ncbi:sigma factor-like helix-turn-helix DNA-binding protein [Halobiforma nitratireducens]|uniref:RNA polymerase, sigma-24 subunit, ECF subfamily protein n=1 Tax=Halobiforma nitratireducens JCM 10879 TaxID=1227454 RepID=M0L4F6_9EURY|nr:sigma factor-like helix-turn-helix DNA-binding protein [Halobiforma nitratireducens]EMA27319.1 RNA polymerase, sigma-24 subunit, ECF subfamily protein [Halobiforma nitratireducens JCM 10879]
MSSEQATLVDFEPDLSALTDAEREAYRACRIEGTGVREYARETERRPGTIGNLLARAEAKLENGGQR